MNPKHTAISKYRAGCKRFGRVFGCMLGAALAAGTGVAAAQVAAQPPRNYPVPGGSLTSAPQIQLPALPVKTAITPNGRIVEDVIARVNDQIITRSEYERAEQQMVAESQQQNLPAAEANERLRNMLRDMIDQQLLLSRGKELGITGDAETVRRLDEIRKQNHLESMEALEKAAAQQGVSYEDFKQGIRNNIITQQVVRDEVGRRLQLTRAAETEYYNAHMKDFEVPEQVHLSEILIPTPETATDAQIADAQAKADAAAAQLKAGKTFAEVAKATSGGPTAAAGGDLGDFKRGTLGQVLEDATFGLPQGGVTAPIRTRQGFVILRVDSHQAAGTPPLDQVEPQVQEAIYLDALQPALRAYLTKAREDAYVDIQAGFVDTGSNRKESKPAFTAYAPPPLKKKIANKQRAETAKAAKAQVSLAAAREKVAAKAAAKNAATAQKNGATDVSKPVKPKKIRKEKIRYGQAPRNALPPGPVASLGEETAATAAPGEPLQGQAAGVAMAPTEATTSISTGTAATTDENADPLAPQAAPARKSRFSSRQTQAEEDKAKTTLAKAEVKASARPVVATTQETATEKQQAAPLGLNGDTEKKKPKVKRKKGDPKERLQEKAKPVETPVQIAPTVNPALGASPTVTTTTPPTTAPASTAPSADATTLPSTTSAPGALPQGQPVPAATSATPGAPATTPPPH